MTSIAYEHRPSRAPLGFFLAALLTVFISGALMLYGQYERRPVPKPYPMPKPNHIDTSQSHAVRDHGIEEVTRAYHCYGNNPMADGVFKHKHTEHKWVWIILCKDADGRWYARVVRMLKGTVTEITAFMIKGGTENWEVIGNWLRKKITEEAGNMVTKAAQLPWK